MDSTTHRILDANANRAREALRVMEEFARFVLNDGPLSVALKQTRHDLGDAVMLLELRRVLDTDESGADARPDGGLIIHRDITRDVGRDVSARGEGVRVDSVHVVVAAGKSLSDAMHVREEYGKVVSRPFAVAMESNIHTEMYKKFESRPAPSLPPLPELVGPPSLTSR